MPPECIDQKANVKKRKEKENLNIVACKYF